MNLFLVVPCYNEEEVLPDTAKKLLAKMEALCSSGAITQGSIVFVDDGSKDGTWAIIERLHEENERFRGIRLSRNRGHQNALLAGLLTVKSECDAAISLDADLQDDIDAIDAMLKKYKEGYEIVYGVRSDRKKDSAFKRTTAIAFYKLMRAMGVELVYNHADFRLMGRRALDALETFPEVNIFLRGMVPMIGFKSATVEYVRGVRLAGESKYPFRKMLEFSFEGITSLSVKPIRVITTVGILMFLFSLGYLVYSLVRYFCGFTVPGWTSTVISIWAVGGLNMLSLGIIGEYIGKIYLETKKRPRYIIDTYLGGDLPKDRA